MCAYLVVFAVSLLALTAQYSLREEISYESTSYADNGI